MWRGAGRMVLCRVVLFGAVEVALPNQRARVHNGVTLHQLW
jgi:hypothetical protein